MGSKKEKKRTRTREAVGEERAGAGEGAGAGTDKIPPKIVWVQDVKEKDVMVG